MAVFLSGAFAAGASAAVFANDPTQLSIGARELGMGRAFVGLADDTSAIFYNPAGLGQQTEWQVSTMQGKYVNTFDYLQLSALYPTDLGTFGIGYGGSSIGFSFPSSEVIIIGGERRIIPTGEVSGSYSNTALLLSYGKKFNFYSLKNISLGSSLKLLSQNLSANVAASGTASGLELTVGSFYPINSDWKVGASVLDILPAALGGKVKWSNGTEETLPAKLKLGLSYTNLNNKAITSPKVNLAIDYDQYLNRRDVPSLAHLGVEWFPAPTFALRAGIDQSSIANPAGGYSVSNDVTYGLGLFYNNYRFDFAYHMYNNLVADTTSYFSLGYSPAKKPEVVERKYFSVTSPANGARVYEPKIDIAGRLLDKSVGQIMVGTAEATLKGDNFNLFVNAKLGGNVYMVEARDKKNLLLGRFRLRVVRFISFLDVYNGYWSQLPIEELATLGIITGYPDLTFRPENTIDRAELTTLLVRSQDKWPASAKAKQLKFRKLSAGIGDDPFPAMLDEMKKVRGFHDETFLPEGKISRAESLVMVGRFFDLPTPESLALPYNDIIKPYWAGTYIATLLEAGACDFISGKKLEPDRPLTLGEMNAMFQALGVEGSYPKENYDPDEKVGCEELASYLFKIKEKAVAAQVTAKIEAKRNLPAAAIQLKEIPRAAGSTQKQKMKELMTLGVVEVTPGSAFKLEANLTRGDLAAWLAKTNGFPLPKIDTDLYQDVKKNNPLAPYIKTVVDAGLMAPYPDGTFRPEKYIDQADAALVTTQGALAKTPGEAQRFPDVPRNHWAANYIYQAVDRGLVTGYPNGTFQPAKPISRAEGLSVIARFAGLISKRSISEAPYVDIPGRYWAAPEISAAKDGGLLDYIKGDTFSPNADLQRSEVAYILSRVNSIKQVINEQL
jgi:hypothetical protein